MNYQNLPAKVGFGAKAYSMLPSLAQTLIIHGSSVEVDEFVEKIKKITSSNVSFFQLRDERRSIKKIENLSKKFKDVDCFIIIGGGSIIDSCKVLFKSLTNNSDKKKFFIPTLLGSGSESSMTAIINTRSKKNIFIDESFLPDGIIYDFKILKLIRNDLLILGHIDALIHCYESLTSINSNPFSEFLARNTIKNFLENFKEKKNKFFEIDNEFIKELSLLSFNGGICQSNAGAGLTHALAHSTEELTKIPHSICISFFSKSILNYLILNHKNLSFEKFEEIQKHVSFLWDHLEKKNLFSDIKNFLKNNQNFEKVLELSKKDPCWRLFKLKIDEEFLKKNIKRSYET